MEREGYHHEFDDEQKLRNFILADNAFYNKFKEEWTDITNKLKQIHEMSKLGRNSKTENQIIRPSSSSVIFK